MMSDAEKIKALAFEAGFEAVGITSFHRLEQGENALHQWVKEGKHAGMSYLESFPDRKRRFLEAFRGIPKSILVLGVNYFHKSPLLPPEESRGKAGRVARYAWGEDYHLAISRRHAVLIQKIQEAWKGEVTARSCVDIQPIVERSAAVQAGLGFGGKHTNLLNARYGPWLFLSEIVLDLELEEDLPAKGHCGTCSLCQVKCPTGALNRDYELDARLCIAYWTIEHKGIIPREMRPLVGDWIFGCDECLSVCPFGSKAKEAAWPEWKANGRSGPWLDISELFEIQSNREFERRFQGTALLRVNRKQMLRNACVVLGNTQGPEAPPLLKKGLLDPSPLVRIHAVWALKRIGSFESKQAVEFARSVEKDADVLEEMNAL